MAKEIGYFTPTKLPTEGKLGFLFKRYSVFPKIRIPTFIWKRMPLIAIFLSLAHLILGLVQDIDIRFHFWVIDSMMNISTYHQIQAVICFGLAFMIIFARNRYYRHCKKQKKLSWSWYEKKSHFLGFFYFFRII